MQPIKNLQQLTLDTLVEQVSEGKLSPKGISGPIANKIVEAAFEKLRANEVLAEEKWRGIACTELNTKSLSSTNIKEL